MYLQQNASPTLKAAPEKRGSRNQKIKLRPENFPPPPLVLLFRMHTAEAPYFLSDRYDDDAVAAFASSLPPPPVDSLRSRRCWSGSARPQCSECLIPGRDDDAVLLLRVMGRLSPSKCEKSPRRVLKR